VITGIALGFSYVLLVAPVMVFAAGKNDSWPELLTIAMLFTSGLPASILAIFHRKAAGIWLTTVAICAAAAGSWNTYNVLSSHGIPADSGEVLGSAFLELPAVLVGVFLWLTGVLGWPELRTRKTLSTQTE
jgi:hypothetical protein